LYHLTGLISCPECRHKLVGTSAKGRTKIYRYYTCFTPSPGPRPLTRSSPRPTLDLRDLAYRERRSADATHRIQALRDTYRNRPALLQRLDRAGLTPLTT